MGDHGYGHGDTCYWCGADGDTEDDRPCDERLRKKPTEHQMNHYHCVAAIEDAKIELEAAELTCEKHGYRAAAKEVYHVRLLLSDAHRRLEALRPEGQGDG
jgi:hypothetical protein